MADTESPKKTTAGVGMPQTLYLHEFGSQVWAGFGNLPYLVGSALTGKSWRDVDVRLLLEDEEYVRLFPGVKGYWDEHLDGKWVAWCLAWSALGERLTGLPIDFQIQRQSEANALYNGPRSALGLTPLRMKREASDG